MIASLLRFINRLLMPVPAYLMIIAGMTLLGLSLLMPAWMESRELAWQMDLMKLQSQRLDEQEKNYRHFNEALASDDPVLLERLAFYHLRLKPAGATPLIANAALTAPAGRAAGHLQRMPTIDDLLRRPVPQPGVDVPDYKPLRTRLILLTTGPMRLGVIAAGMMCLLAGLTAPVRPDKTAETFPEFSSPIATVAAPVLAPAPAASAPVAVVEMPTTATDAGPTLRQRSQAMVEKLRLRLRRWGA